MSERIHNAVAIAILMLALCLACVRELYAGTQRASPDLLPVTVQGRYLIAGDKPLFIKGVCYQPYWMIRRDKALWPKNAFTPKMVEQDFKIMHRLGINAVRVYSIPSILQRGLKKGEGPYETFFDLADQNGLYVVPDLPTLCGESANWNNDMSPANLKRIESKAAAAIHRYQHHPCILAWSLGNEIYWAKKYRYNANLADAERFLERLAAYLKQKYPNALTTYADVGAFIDSLGENGLSIYGANIYQFNNSPKAFADAVRTMRTRWAFDRPIWITEWGFSSKRDGKQAQADLLEANWRMMMKKGMVGGFYYCFADISSPTLPKATKHSFGYYGLVNWQRQLKPAATRYAQLQGPAIWSPMETFVIRRLPANLVVHSRLDADRITLSPTESDVTAAVSISPIQGNTFNINWPAASGTRLDLTAVVHDAPPLATSRLWIPIRYGFPLVVDKASLNLRRQIAEIMLRNPGSQSIRAQIGIDWPAGITQVRDIPPVEVGPAASRIMKVPVRGIPASASGCRLTVTTTTPPRQWRVPMTVSAFHLIPRTSHILSLHGPAEKWLAGTPITLTVLQDQATGRRYRGRCWLQWDRHNLYVMAAANDQHLVNHHTGRSLWNGDVFELFLDLTSLDAASDVEGKGAKYTPLTVQLMFAPTSKSGRPQLFIRSQEGSVPVPKVLHWVAQRTSRGYRIRAVIPWRSLFGAGAYLPDAGRVIGLGVAFGNSFGKDRQMHLMWGSGSTSQLESMAFDRRLFGVARLLP